jgi:pectate lyase
MKKRILFSLFLLSIFSVQSQNYYMSSPQGYGAIATGGGSATPITVTTFAQLKAALPTTSTNKVILISGTIDCT